MLTAYTRRSLGQSYLKQVLSQGISKLVEDDDLNLQINPLKVCVTSCYHINQEIINCLHRYMTS